MQDFFQRGARKKAENQGHSSIELEMYKQYILKLGIKKNVWNYDMHANRVANSAVLSYRYMYKQYMDELHAKQASNYTVAIATVPF